MFAGSKAIRLGFVFWVVIVGACRTSQHETDAWLGFVTACAERTWEECRRSDNQQDTTSTAPFQDMLTRAFNDVWPLLESEARRDEFELIVMGDRVTAFRFEARRINRGGDDVRIIRTTSETFATISKMAIARHFYGLLPEVPEA